MSRLRESKGQECKPLQRGRLRAGEQPVEKRTRGSPRWTCSWSLGLCDHLFWEPRPGVQGSWDCQLCLAPSLAHSLHVSALRPEVAFLPVCMHDPRRPAVNLGNAGNGTGFGASSPRQPLPQEMLP